MSVENYPYRDISIGGGDMGQYLIKKHFEIHGAPIKRAALIKSIITYHVSKGGLPTNEETLKSSMKAALQKLLETKYLIRAERKGYYKLYDVNNNDLTSTQSITLTDETKSVRKSISRKEREKLIDQLLNVQRFRCGSVLDHRTWGCRNKFGLDLYEIPPYVEIDHIVAIRNKGKDDYSNLQALCLSCHKYKSAHEQDGFNYCRYAVNEENTTRLESKEIKDFVQENDVLNNDDLATDVDQNDSNKSNTSFDSEESSSDSDNDDYEGDDTFDDCSNYANKKDVDSRDNYDSDSGKFKD
mmetsp:Transcript_20064/g.18217  ORF Transcript_20064/g.18217 Transcript_20064/m.18217 type:complete len:298 (+) Transcript_20064:72-965(+)